jgi:hypothetical protein
MGRGKKRVVVEEVEEENDDVTNRSGSDYNDSYTVTYFPHTEIQLFIITTV